MEKGCLQEAGGCDILQRDRRDQHEHKNLLCPGGHYEGPSRGRHRQRGEHQPAGRRGRGRRHPPGRGPGAAGGMPGPRARSCWRNAGRWAAAGPERQRSPGPTACPAAMLCTRQARSGTAGQTASARSWPPATGPAWRWRQKTAAAASPFPRSRRASITSRWTRRRQSPCRRRGSLSRNIRTAWMSSNGSSLMREPWPPTKKSSAERKNNRLPACMPAENLLQ